MKRVLISMTIFCLSMLPAAGWAAESGWRNLSPTDKEKVLRNYQRWQKLPDQDKERLREEWNRWQRLPEDRRDRLKRRYEEQRKQRRD